MDEVANSAEPRVWVGPEPWPQQVAGYERCRSHFLRGTPCRGLVQMPTGTGKSRLMRAVTYLALHQRRRVLLVVPTEEILLQQEADLRAESLQPFYREKAEREAPSYARLVVASHQTIWRRLRYYAADWLLLFDEAHHSNGQALRNLLTLRRFHQAIGFTASAWSEECEEVYNGQVLYTYPLRQAITDGFLCDYSLHEFPAVVPAPERHELYYCASNEEARALAKATPGTAFLLDGCHDREARVAAFRAGVIRRLYLNRMLTEGFDCPEIARIYIDKATLSDILNYQMVGRGLRKKRRGGRLEVYCRDVIGVHAALKRAG